MTPVSNDLIRLLKSPKIEELLHPKSFFDVTRHEGVKVSQIALNRPDSIFGIYVQMKLARQVGLSVANLNYPLNIPPAAPPLNEEHLILNRNFYIIQPSWDRNPTTFS